jgi:hypothetical protein
LQAIGYRLQVVTVQSPMTTSMFTIASSAACRACALTIPLLAVLLCSCAGDKSGRTLEVDDEYHVIPSRETMPEVMRAKLAHAQALMEALAMGSFPHISANASALVEISQRADWLVHDTEAYYALSENFRKAAQALNDDGQRKDLQAATRDYNALVASCIACHRYLQAEKPTLDMPGKVSMTMRR